jgi:hypothetical protein
MSQRYAEQSEGRRIGPWWLVPADTKILDIEKVLGRYNRSEPALDAAARAAPICNGQIDPNVYC